MNISDSPINHLAIARSSLLEPHDLVDADVFKTLAQITQGQVDYADIYFEISHSEGWSLEDGIVKTGSYTIDKGVGVRAVAGERTAFAHSGEISKSALARAAHATREIGRVGAKTRVDEPRKFRAAEVQKLYLPSDPLSGMSATEKTQLLKNVEQLARACDPRVTQVMAQLTGEYKTMLVVRADGLIAADVRPLVNLSVTVMVEEGGKREVGSSGGGGRFDYSEIDTLFVKNHVNAAVQHAIVNLAAQPAPAGEMTVVLGAGWPGVMIHEAIGHGLEGDFNRKGTSVFSGRIGERVAAKGVSIVDDGTLPRRRGSLNVDDEGNASRCTTLIEDGILRGYMQDALNARLMGTDVTGNGRRQSYSALPMPRMTNTYMLNGPHHPGEIIESVKCGIYAVNFGGGQVDITTGKFVFGATQAYMIENGKVTYPVKGATLIGSGPESLKRVSMVGNDMRLDEGIASCGKEGQTVPVGVGQPTLRLDGMTVGGTR
ncbi:metalloprotease TldD [Paraburkholderia sp. J94]|uniref:metalloprotease TldD n=1 Tax=Paraburkholderia sp. J94 TaxID=2805441 RepID=UPI002AB1D1E0|nr:metalloprotease TldD [Paraburkholderia sp. J94]